MEAKDAVILGLLGTGGVVTGVGIYYVLKGRSRSEELEKVLEEQEELLNDVKAEVQGVAIELQNAEYPMSEAVADGIAREMALWEWKLNKAIELNEKAQDLGSDQNFIEEFTQTIADTLKEVGIFVLKGVIAAAVAVGIAKGAMYFGPKILKAIIEWIRGSRGGPPPPWTCGGCGAQFGNEAQLQEHVESEHTPTSNESSIAQAKAQFNALSNPVANAVAAESGLYRNTGSNWKNLAGLDLLRLSWGSMAVENVGLGTAVEISLMRSVSTLLLAL